MAEKNNNSQQIGDVVKVRHEKLAELVANNADPFVITKFDRTHTTKEIKENYSNSSSEFNNLLMWLLYE